MQFCRNRRVDFCSVFIFFLPGLSKVIGYSADTLSLHVSSTTYRLRSCLLPITIVLQIAGGVMLMIGMRVAARGT